MFSWQDFKTNLDLDNQKFERMYAKASWLGSRSRLHELVERLQQPPVPTAVQVRQIISRIPADAWTKYVHVKAYLARQFALAGFEIPAGQQAVINRQVKHIGTVVTGYPAGHQHATLTGLRSRPDGRFYWSIEVCYTLANGMDPNEYVPVRESKDSMEYRTGRPTPLRGAVRDTAYHQVWAADGPVHYNVKRDTARHTISIWDGPGCDMQNAVLLTANPNHYPIRLCDLFQMRLFKVQPGAILQAAQVPHGEELPGSYVAFHFEMWKDSPQDAPQGLFTNDG
jgi:hypothetical protein